MLPIRCDLIDPSADEQLFCVEKKQAFQFELNARLLRVCETVYDGHFDQPKTKRSTRTIPIGTETVEILAALHSAAVDPKALVFATREGLPLERWNLLRKHLKPSAKKLGLPGVTWHLLRHSHAMMLDSVGTPLVFRL